TVTKPQRTVTKPQRTVTKPQRTVTKPQRTVTKPQRTVTKREIGVKVLKPIRFIAIVCSGTKHRQVFICMCRYLKTTIAPA
ncbi:MAG TPA: hypothetical protein PK715_00600, partial [Chitinophagales bacterium]|nr:hypothetical protein [Chitinophagales bacterium]